MSQDTVTGYDEINDLLADTSLDDEEVEALSEILAELTEDVPAFTVTPDDSNPDYLFLTIRVPK